MLAGRNVAPDPRRAQIWMIVRLPARDRRWRTWAPEEALIGAVPLHEAKCALLGNRVMSMTSTSSRAAPEGPMPCKVVSVLPVAASRALSSLLAAFLRW